MKTILSSIFILALFVFGSINVQADDSHLHATINDIEAAVQATDAKEVQEHLREALGHARQEVKFSSENKYIREGLNHLEEAYKKAQANNLDQAKNDAAVSLDRFKHVHGE